MPPNPNLPSAQLVFIESAQHSAACGDFAGAVRHYAKAREYCVGAQGGPVTLALIECAVVAGEWNVVGRSVDSSSMQAFDSFFSSQPLCV